MTSHESAVERRILQPGRNCWRLAKASRVAFLIDAADYFAALRSAALCAQRSIFILGWDIDSRTKMLLEDPADEYPIYLGAFLKTLVERRDELEIYILNWDFAMLYAIDRELLPIYTNGWQTHRRLHFHLDGVHPVGASHHQKIVVVDDKVAFVGGMDLAQARWDKSLHEPKAPYRYRSNGQSYPPVHDVQVMVEGEAAAALGELARERWRKATGQTINAKGSAGGTPWPSSVVPDIHDVEVAIARTLPHFNGSPGVFEIRQLYLDAIAAAKRFIYFENQYLTASIIGRAIEARLREPGGSEIVVVSRLSGGGWLEENTMSVLRARLLRRLRAADRYGKFRIYYPDCAGLSPECINVHSKLMVMDDRLVQIGSANLANRSMGLDTECDLAIEGTELRIREAIARFRSRLLGEHLGVDPDRVREEIQQNGSVIRTIELLRGNERTLRPLEGEIPPEVDAAVPEASVIDPEKPIDPDRLIDEVLPVEHRSAARKRMILAFAVLVGMGAAAAAWHWGPLAEWFGKESLINIANRMQEASATPVWVLGAYLIAALTAMPITLVIFVTALVFGPVAGFIYAFCGALLGASVTFGIGRRIGRDLVRRLAGQHLNALSHWLRRQGLLAIIAVRVIPVAPFTVVNLVAGASHIRFRDFLLGTALGMAPGTIGITLFSDRLTAALLEPTAFNMALLAGAVIMIAAAIFGLHRWLRRRDAANEPCSSEG